MFCFYFSNDFVTIYESRIARKAINSFNISFCDLLMLSISVIVVVVIIIIVVIKVPASITH